MQQGGQLVTAVMQSLARAARAQTAALGPADALCIGSGRGGVNDSFEEVYGLQGY
jgi:hypothetical protein